MLKFITSGSTAGAIFILALVIASGLYLGRFKVKGISLGSTWILFVGIILSHFGLRINPTMLSFIKDFGLILFVFAIGLQVGPGFFRSFRKDGLPMNILAIALVLLAALTAFGIHLITGEDLSIMTGCCPADYFRRHNRVRRHCRGCRSRFFQARFRLCSRLPSRRAGSPFPADGVPRDLQGKH